MITAGIDMGTQSVKVVILKNGEIVSRTQAFSGFYPTKAAEQAFEEALKKAKDIKPDLILLDIVLPKMDGFEVLQRIKKDAAFSGIKVIALTNLGQKEEIEKGLGLGADDYIVKAHFTPSEVINKVKQVLNKNV